MNNHTSDGGGADSPSDHPTPDPDDAVNEILEEDLRRKRILDRAENEIDKREARRMADAMEAEQRGTSSWGRIDPERALEAAKNPREPEVGRFTDGFGVFYLGCINEVHGPSECGKSWFVLYIVAQMLKGRHIVVYVDYEDDEGGVYRRLKLLGVTEETLGGDLFRYHRPNGPLTEAERATFMESARDAYAAIFDGMTEGMALEGLSPRDETEVATWHGKVTKDMAHDGKAVMVVDHTPHGESRTLGSQHKKSAVTGVSYEVEAITPIDAGERGVLRLRVAKDRLASVRRESAPGKAPRWRGDLVVDFTAGLTPVVNLWPAGPSAGKQDPGFEKPVEFMKRVGDALSAQDGKPLSNNQLEAIVKGDAKRVRAALEFLVQEGYVKQIKKGRGYENTLIRPFVPDEK